MIESNKKIDEIFCAPNCDINFNIMSQIIFEAWPKHSFNIIVGAPECKEFYNKSYKIAQKRLYDLLDKYTPAAWARVAYMQLEIWSIIHWHGNENSKIKFNINGPENFAPVGRYGWRYILEHSLEKCTEQTSNVNDNRPTDIDINEAMTLITILCQAAELSNYLHFFSEKYKSIKIDFSPFVFMDMPKLNENDVNETNLLREQMSKKIDASLYPQFNPLGNKQFLEELNTFLRTNFNFDLDDVVILAERILNEIPRENNASILIDSYDRFSILCSSITGYALSKIHNIFNVLLLDVSDSDYTTRDFLVKSQQKRMINYAGAIINTGNNLLSIYDTIAANDPLIKNSTKHIILSAYLIEEWINTFVFKIAYGQRNDLKNISLKIRRELSKLEEYFHKKIFEEEIKKIFRGCNYFCMSLKKIHGKDIECGEIDLLAYSPSDEFFFIAEAKNLAPPTDAKAMEQIIKDHFNQKKYHNKFLKKISWVKNNIDSIRNLFHSEYNAEIKHDIKIAPLFITGSYSIIKYLVSEYNVIPFTELNHILSHEHKQF